MEQLLIRFGYLVVDNPRIKEIDINPLLASPDGLLALDARVVLHDASVKDEALPHPAIRPYPIQLRQPGALKNGKHVEIRPILHQDEPLFIKFHETLSEQSVYLRYFQALKLTQRVTHERLLRRCFIDYDREMALVAEGKNDSGEREIVGVGRLIKLHGRPKPNSPWSCRTPYQKQGLGKELMKRLLQIARDEKVQRVVADILRENTGMVRLCEELGFAMKDAPTDSILKAELAL